ncbi:TPA: hypothetical protein U1D08_002127 [Streptococcus suis]|nr:hypothetical protein [Streptococcus suis]
MLAICTKISASDVTCSRVSFASVTVEVLEAMSLELVSEVDEAVSLVLVSEVDEAVSFVDDDELVLV